MLPQSHPVHQLRYLQEFRSRRSEIDALYRMRMDHMVEVNQPLVLISQIERSGGTLLNSLFDGHPQCLTHSYELHIGHPQKWDWPDLDLAADPEDWFKILFEPVNIRLFREGYSKRGVKLESERPKLPFFLLPNLQREVFTQCISATNVKSQRDIIDCYMTSYFNAIVDYREIYYQQKKYVVGFIPRMNMHQESLARFFRDYPNGRLITIVRNPVTWYASANKFKPQNFPNVDESIALWRRSTEYSLAARDLYGERVCIVSFDDLVGNTPETVRELAAFLDIQYDDILLQPTLHRTPTQPNSSYSDAGQGGVKNVLDRPVSLSFEEVAQIEMLANDLYKTALGQLSIKVS